MRPSGNHQITEYRTQTSALKNASSARGRSSTAMAQVIAANHSTKGR